jgi:hypothetical protein
VRTELNRTEMGGGLRSIFFNAKTQRSRRRKRGKQSVNRSFRGGWRLENALYDRRFLIVFGKCLR